jgi:hypothetical protein
MRLNLFSPVLSMSAGEKKLLADLGITTGAVGLGVELATSSFLVTDSTDPDVILQKLEENQALQNALETDPEEVLSLFGNDVESEVTVTGTTDIHLGITLSQGMSFSLSDGIHTATVEFDAGFHTGSNVMSAITNAMAVAGFNNSIRVYIPVVPPTGFKRTPDR